MIVKLKDICSVIVPMRDKPKKYVDKGLGLPWCRIEDIEGKYLNGTKSGQYVDADTIAAMNLKVFPAGTVICAVTGASIGTYAITTRELITNQTFAGLVCGPEIYNQFLYYFVKLHTNMFINMSVGCAQAYITRETFENLEIDLPPYDTQVKIVKLLERCDDRITNNHAICTDLESMAKLLYDYWFVQFDFPDENGKPYKSSGGKMVWNEELKREIPEGWEVRPASHYITPIKGISYSAEDLLGNGVKMFNLNSFSEDGTYKVAGIKTYTGTVPAERTVSPNDLIMCVTQQTSIDLSGKKNVIGKALLAPDLGEETTTMSMDVVKLVPRSEEQLAFFKYLFGLPYVHKYIVGYANGTKIKHLDVEGALSLPVAMPPEDFKPLEEFSKRALDINRTTSNSITENQQLAELRDFLLPMLMNGQVKVGEGAAS